MPDKLHVVSGVIVPAVKLMVSANIDNCTPVIRNMLEKILVAITLRFNVHKTVCSNDIAS
jgi:hypothetical protein